MYLGGVRCVNITRWFVTPYLLCGLCDITGWGVHYQPGCEITGRSVTQYQAGCDTLPGWVCDITVWGVKYFRMGCETLPGGVRDITILGVRHFRVGCDITRLSVGHYRTGCGGVRHYRVGNGDQPKSIDAVLVGYQVCKYYQEVEVTGLGQGSQGSQLGGRCLLTAGQSTDALMWPSFCRHRYTSA